MSVNELARAWIKAKDAEAKAIAERRRIEDLLIDARISTQIEGTAKTMADGLQITVTSRLARKVDGDMLQDIAAEHGLTEHLGHLFRWKPEINMAAWKAADNSITSPLLAAITTKPGRPSFKIESTEE